MSTTMLVISAINRWRPGCAALDFGCGRFTRASWQGPASGVNVTLDTQTAAAVKAVITDFESELQAASMVRQTPDVTAAAARPFSVV
ncbi:MAG: hypothetical protein WBL61_12095, partial [Bryobacteraceae bacterium]